MRACYPDQVGGDNPVSPVVDWFSPGVPVWDSRPRLGLHSLATTVAGVMRTQGPPKAYLRGRKSAGGTMKESWVR